MIRTGSSLSAVMQFIANTQILAHKVNCITDLAAPHFYQRLRLVHQHITEKYPMTETLAKTDALQFEGRSIIFNRQTPLHKDKTDPPLAIQILVCLGSFTHGGQIYLPQLKLTIQFKPGDAVVLRGAKLEHGILPWYGGDRFSIVHFTHNSIWNESGISLDLDQEWHSTFNQRFAETTHQSNISTKVNTKRCYPRNRRRDRRRNRSK